VSWIVLHVMLSFFLTTFFYSLQSILFKYKSFDQMEKDMLIALENKKKAFLRLASLQEKHDKVITYTIVSLNKFINRA
jgi:hypothetical protein